jgi:hypothetical protein
LQRTLQPVSKPTSRTLAAFAMIAMVLKRPVRFPVAFMQRQLGFLVTWMITTSIPLGMFAGENVTLTPGGPPAQREPDDETPRAPNQYPQPVYIPSQRSIYAAPSVEDVFEGNVYEEPEFLPPEAYGDDPENAPHRSPASPDSPRPGHSLDLAVYPFHDSGPRDFDPEGHYQHPRWNPVPLAPLEAPPEDPAVGSPLFGLATKERSATATVLPGSGDQLGITTLDFRTTLYPARLPLVMFSPRFSWHFLNGPTTTDLPPRLFDVAMEFQLFVPISERWSFFGGVAPSLFSDFNNFTSDAVRITGHGLLFYEWSEHLKLAGGFLYLDRDDVTALPAAGIIYRPDNDFRAEIMFPKPKVSYRIRQNGDRESWAYLAGEFGGGTWGIERSVGANDVVTYRDFRLMLGLEQVRGDAYRWFVEGGYIFGRRIEYRSQVGDMDLPDAGMIRLGLVF